MKDKHLSIRIPMEIYQQYVDETIKRTNNEKILVKVSEVIREALERGLKDVR